LVVASGAGANSRWSLGTAVCGGMLMATALGVFFIPVLYVVIERLIQRLTRRGQPESTPVSEATVDAKERS